MYRNFTLTESERIQILEQHKNHGYGKPLNEQNGIDYKRVSFFDNLAKQIARNIVGKKYFFGDIGVLKNTNIIVEKYSDRNQNINGAGKPVKELVLWFAVRRVEEDLNVGEKMGTRIWRGGLRIEAKFENGVISSNPDVSLYRYDSKGEPVFDNDISLDMKPSKPWTWDMVGGANLWSKALSIS